MAEEEDGLGRFTGARGPRAEASFKNIAEVQLPMQFNAAAKLPQVCRGESNAGIHGGFRVGGRLGLNELAGEIEERTLFAPRPSQQGAHGDGICGIERHLRPWWRL
jgi:hypothetical protein